MLEWQVKLTCLAEQPNAKESSLGNLPCQMEQMLQEVPALLHNFPTWRHCVVQYDHPAMKTHCHMYMDH